MRSAVEQAACSGVGRRLAGDPINALAVRLRGLKPEPGMASRKKLAVAAQDRGRGYELARGHYLIVSDEELQAIEIESTHTIEIDRFVPRSQLDQRNRTGNQGKFEVAFPVGTHNQLLLLRGYARKAVCKGRDALFNPLAPWEPLRPARTLFLDRCAKRCRY